MSTLIALFRRLLFRRRGTTEKASDESVKSQKPRTKSLNIPATNGSLREKTRIQVKRGSQVVIRNRSQSVTVERKHVSRGTSDKQNSPSSRRQSHYTIHKGGNNLPTSLAPTLTSSYRMRSSSATKPTIIYIH
ncbi:uncharacterized protein CELE_F28F5.6 [Caenorhabditis elegans]|uniref:Secreted protein n=1 Tax=Caenorhabditis elegans TaxID=6239 RepID=Q8MNS9_CAEEL|nr:Secreted protein [Caenorhabditis elegans]CCD70169.1 Secreted protein [Caenorhabditis elegans]|eukprot:NP_741202.1 Uncharacterized protein CELE_F28F5.6 [Caenorhabditis elegans]